MSESDNIDLNQEPANTKQINSAIEVAEIEFDAPMEIKKVSKTKGKPTELILLIHEHDDSSKPSVYGDETGLNSVGGKLMYAEKHNHMLMISAISVQPKVEKTNDDAG